MRTRKLPCPDSIITNSSNFTELAFSRRHAAGRCKLVAKLLVKADLRGYPGHGVTRVAPGVDQGRNNQAFAKGLR